MFLFSNKMKSSCVQAEDQARTCSWNVNVFQPLHSVVALINFALTKKSFNSKAYSKPCQIFKTELFSSFQFVF